MANLPLIFRPTVELENTHPLPKAYLGLIGAGAGFVSGLTGAVGLLFNRFYLRYGLQKEEIVATRAANEVLLHLVKLILYASFGLLTGKALAFGGVIAVAAMLSSWGMKWLLPRLSESLFRRVGYSAMVVSGLSLSTEAGAHVVANDSVAISYSPLSTGIETQLQWRKKLFALEFEYDEGFEFERSIAFTDLPPAKQGRVKLLSQGVDRVFLEEVYGIDRHTYEAYIFRREKLEKVDL